MKTPRHFSAALSAGLLCCVFYLSPVAAKDNWTRVRSKNFTLVGNASEKEIRRVGTKLEQFHDVFSRLMTKAVLKSSVPTTVIVFKSDGSYKPFKPLYQGKPASVAGYFQSGEDVNYITLTTESSAENPYRIIFHEYTHLLINNNVQTPPVWFNEGLAEYYSTFDVSDDDKKAFLGRVVANHVLLLRQKFIPLSALFSVDHRSPLYNERDKQSIFYAQSWAVMHYLLLGNNGARREQLSAYLTNIARGVPVEQAFTQSMQTDFRSFEKELREYVSRTTYPAQTATFANKLEFDAEMSAEPITEADSLAYLGDLLLHINRPEDAVVRLEQALAANPDQAMAHASLGMALMRQKKFAPAREHLARAAALDSQNHLVHYYYAYVLSREGMDDNGLVQTYPGTTAEKMRAELKKAIELRPDFPESYHLLSFINLVTEEQFDESIAMIRKASALAPGREQYSLVLGQLYLRKREPKAARQIFEQLARSSPEPSTRDFATAMLKHVASYEEYLAATNNRNDSAAASSPPGEKPSLGRRDAPSEFPNETSANVNPSSPADPEAEREAAELAALKEALRKPAEGEEQAQGRLTSIDCGAGGVILNLQIEGRTLRLHSAKLETIDFITYASNVSGEIKCGARRPATPAVITYKPSRNPRLKYDGEIVGVDLVPEKFLGGK
ncbi:MAG TPA: tetratricopeptide repeat protein [Pyrinomonadaceae bacterium]|jgi:tetratricopeptide (TPR) repeat protein|nr:tetratricopeptide repeat protein [Pyrinomonadaceae bacterium]